MSASYGLAMLALKSDAPMEQRQNGIDGLNRFNSESTLMTTSERIVNRLLENDFQGPPAPDNFLNAVGSTRDLRDLDRKKDTVMRQMEVALQVERQLRKAGDTHDQVAHFIRAEEKRSEKHREGK